MNRRRFLRTVGVNLLAAPLVAEAQPATRIARLGFLGLVSASSHASRLAAFREGLQAPRPGGNVTGLTFFNPELAAKRLELLKEFVPGLTRAAVLLNSANPSNALIVKELEGAAAALKIRLPRCEARGPRDFEGAFAAMASQRAGAVVIHEDTMLNANATTIVQLAAAAPSSGRRRGRHAAAGRLLEGVGELDQPWLAARRAREADTER